MIKSKFRSDESSKCCNSTHEHVLLWKNFPTRPYTPNSKLKRRRYKPCKMRRQTCPSAEKWRQGLCLSPLSQQAKPSSCLVTIREWLDMPLSWQGTSNSLIFPFFAIFLIFLQTLVINRNFYHLPHKLHHHFHEFLSSPLPNSPFCCLETSFGGFSPASG